MPTDNTGLSRRKLLRTTAIGVPAAGLLAFGSTLVTATSANAVEVDGWWGPETSAGIQRLMIAMFPKEQEIFPITVDGIISAQPSDMAPYLPRYCWRLGMGRSCSADSSGTQYGIAHNREDATLDGFIF